MKAKRVGIICAMQIEAEHLLENMTEKTCEEIGSVVFHRGNVGEREVILAVCGIGKVFSALCTQTMILTYHPDCILNSGVAGSLSETLSILDIVVSEGFVQHDMDTSVIGDPKGLISGINQVIFPADTALTGALEVCAKALGLATAKGVIATGDQFVADRKRKEEIVSLFHPLVCEMEAGAAAQVAYVNDTPFCAIRCVSDAYAGDAQMDYQQFAPLAARRSADLLLAFLKQQ